MGRHGIDSRSPHPFTETLAVVVSGGRGVVQFGLPDEAVVGSQHDGGQRHGQHVGQYRRQPHPLLVALGRHLALALLAGKGGRTLGVGRGVGGIGSEGRTGVIFFVHPVAGSGTRRHQRAPLCVSLCVGH
ncbi:hypothetical protein C0Q70_13930 [Pomacea canaliculata]|uniref:Uncharacterized protein n=1 Tax=Pomacea canaliculata TaxID=400727 RepID=A0A2T7NYK8_POMCA|nr:hypothetical protein C0Q70_13930 [Pomacea canaliculata]